MMGVRATAERLGVHENTVRNWADAGILPPGRQLPSGYRRFRPADVEALARVLAAGRSPSPRAVRSMDISRLRYPGSAECEGCDQLPPDSVREQVRVHVQLTGHKVRFTVEDVTVYAPLAV